MRPKSSPRTSRIPTRSCWAKTSVIVSALLVTAERAIAQDKLPRAMALADRASALAPNESGRGRADPRR